MNLKTIPILREFYYNYSDATDYLSKTMAKKWFNQSKFFISTGKETFYDFLHSLDHFSKETDNVNFKIDWIKVKEFFKTDLDFIKQIEKAQKQEVKK